MFRLNRSFKELLSCQPWLINKEHLSFTQTGVKKMFNKFKEKSIKVIRVDNCTFELIVDHDVRIIESERDESMNLAEDEKFIIVSDDASIICDVICTHNSISDASTSFIEFVVAI